MTHTYTIRDVTDDLTTVLKLSRLFGADDEGFWIDLDTKERYVHKLDAKDEGKEIVIFQDPLPKGDYYYFNPYAEGLGKKSPASQFFYKTVRMAFDLALERAVMHLTTKVLEHKNASKEDPNHRLSSPLVKMSSVRIDKNNTLFDVVDEDMRKEFSTLFDRSMKDGIVVTPYMSSQWTAKAMCDVLTDQKWDEKFGKDVRKKSLKAFKSAIMGVLGIKNPEDIDTFSVKYDPDLKTAARFYTTLSVYLKMYSRFNEILAEAFGNPLDEINLTEIQEVIDNSSAAYAIAKHMVQPVIPTTSITEASALRSANTSGLSLGGAKGNILPQPTGSRFAPQVVGQPGQSTGGLGFGLKESRFKPLVLSDTPADPFSPMVKPIQQQTGSSLFGSSGQSYGFGQSSYGFGQGGSGFGGGGFNTTPPSNFGAPGVTRRMW